MGVEARGVALLVVATAAEVLEALAGVAEPDEAASRHDDVLDGALVEAGRFVPAKPDTAIAHRHREVSLPEVGRLADVAVRVDDVLAGVVARHAGQDRRRTASVSTRVQFSRAGVQEGPSRGGYGRRRAR